MKRADVEETSSGPYPDLLSVKRHILHLGTFFKGTAI